MMLRGIRGATTAQNTTEDIIEKTKELLLEMAKDNDIKPENICSIFFSVTHDLNAQFPAVAARQIGWDLVPLICSNEIPVPNSLSHCIRILIHYNTEARQEDIKHIYMRGATVLRSDLAKK